MKGYREGERPLKALWSCSASSSGRGTLAGTLRDAIFRTSEISLCFCSLLSGWWGRVRGKLSYLNNEMALKVSIKKNVCIKMHFGKETW